MKNNGIAIGKKAVTFIFNIILLLLAVNLVMNIYTGDRDDSTKPLLGGIRPVVVVSGSMLPEIQINSISIMKYCEISDIEIGDIVMYKHPNLGINITHRVIDAGTTLSGEKYIRTKGDANNNPDNIDVTNDMVIGKLTTTFNGVAPYVSLVMLDNGEINTLALIPVLLVIATTLTVIGMALYSIWILLYSAYIIRFKHKKIEVLAEVYEINNREQFDNIHLVNNLAYTKRDTIQVFIAKVLLARDMNTFEEASKNIKKSQDRLKRLTDNQSKGN